jgi:predicted PurR-regulated permease PerM
LGLWLVGVPSPIALGVIAGLLDFVPFFGPIVAAIPGVLLGFQDSPQTALYAALVYLAVQQLEGNVLQPLAQRWAVHIPPASSLLAVVAFGLLFGIVGILFAVPLAVVTMVLVRKLYVEPLESRSSKEPHRLPPS